MFKNQPNQKIRVFAFNSSSQEPVLGDAANMSCKISKDYGALADLTNNTPTEVEDGYYLFDLSKEETNADFIEFYPDSSSTNVVVLVPASSFDGHTRLGSTITSVPDPGVPGVERTDLDQVFGLSNIDMWADLENEGDATHIATRVAWSISLASKMVKSRIKSTTYTWATVQDDQLIEHAIVLKAGLLLYANRSTDHAADDKVGSPVKQFQRMYHDFWVALENGDISLADDEYETCRNFPAVVSENDSTPTAIDRSTSYAKKLL